MSSKNQPIELLKSGQLLAVTDSLSAGVILQKPYFAEFVGPGAAVGGMFDIECVTLYALGEAEFTVPATLEERQQAFRRRIEDIEMMQQLCESDVPLRQMKSVQFRTMFWPNWQVCCQEPFRWRGNRNLMFFPQLMQNQTA